jgi:ABC-type transport system substrate-binding protein
MLLIIVSAVLPTLVLSQELEANRKVGPYLDKIVYSVIQEEEEQILALQNDEVDLVGDMISPESLNLLSESEYIEVAEVLRNGYGYLTINCNKYPFNITAFRRAFAFALDKEAISDDAWDGLSYPQDSVVPQVNPFSIEGQMSYNYYEDRADIGNQLLEDAGFLDTDADTFREAPDGSNLSVAIEVAASSDIAIAVGEYAEDALHSLNIDAECVLTDFYEYLIPWMPWYSNYDIVFQGEDFDTYEVDWLAYEFWSGYAHEPYYNLPKFQNASYDAWRSQLINGTTYDEVYEAAAEMQKILLYECPIIVCYENVVLSAYRTDKHEGFVNDFSEGVPCFWTNYRAHVQKGPNEPFGGTLRWSNPLDLDSFNFMVTSSKYSLNVLEMLYDSLIRVDKNGRHILWLADSYQIETNDDNSAIPEGHSRFTFDLITGATWSDGTKLTASDVAFSLNYYRDSPGNPYGFDLSYMTAAYSPSTYSLVVEFNTESYWHLHSIAYKPVLPMHIFEDIGLENWNLWNPIPPDDEMILSGPFNVSDYVAGEFVELSRNINYFYSKEDPRIQGSNPLDMHFIMSSVLALAVGIGAIGLYELKHRREI